MIDIERVETLAKTLANTPVTYLEIHDQEGCIRLKRTLVANIAAIPVEGSVPLQDASVPEEFVVTAGRVGIFRKGSRLMRTGDHIEAGDVVGFIEAMRIPNEVVSNYSGVIAQILVEDGSPVEYGQELIILKEDIIDETNL